MTGYVKVRHPEWAKSAAIYEVNLRQYTEEGTFAAFAEHLPRLRDLGVGILWLMPIHPIGVEGRKGRLGSYYAVRDYRAVNPELGTLDDLRALVDDIHALGMRVILDWVGNHSARDNPLTVSNPEWYAKHPDGGFRSTPFLDWSDVIDFDYENPELRAYMIDAMAFWVRDVGVDGFRADVAGFVPVDFWNDARAALEAIEPVFMLAEWESRDLHARAFDMTYGWSLYDALVEACRGGGSARPLWSAFGSKLNAWPDDAITMLFVDNHDKNSWEGTPKAVFGDGLEACMVLTCVAEGMPLVYTGQEAGLDRQLAFFERDPVTWRDHPHTELYRRLFALKRSNRALWNGTAGGRMTPLATDRPERVFAFHRERDGDRVLAVFNFGDEPATVRLLDRFHHGSYEDWRDGAGRRFDDDTRVELPAWGYSLHVVTRGRSSPPLD